MSARRMTSDAWLAVGRMLFTKDLLDFNRWLIGKGPLPQSETFRYRCPACQIEFPSDITPRKCPKGCLAEDIADRVMLTHKGYTAATFPFAV